MAREPPELTDVGEDDERRMESLGVATVYVRSASNLLAADSNGLSDPYVVLHCLGQTHRTHVVKKTLNPTWGITLDFVGRLKDVVAKGLHAEVFDHDTFSRDDPLGEIRIPLDPLEVIDQLHISENLPTQGRLDLSITWVELPPRMLDTGVLTVTLSCAHGLMAADSNGKSDPYVKISLNGQKHRSKVVPKSLDPVWNESFEFQGVLRDLCLSRLHLEVFDHDTFFRDDPLGNADVPLGAFEVVEEKAFHVPLLTTQGHVILWLCWRAEGDLRRTALPTESSVSDLVVERGRLRMRLGSLGSWYDRWFELSEVDLTFYSSHLEAKPKGVLPLPCLRRVIPSKSEPRRFTLQVAATPIVSTSMSATSNTTSSNASIATPEHIAASAPSTTVRTRNIELAAPDVAARERWVRKLLLLTEAATSKAAAAGSVGGGLGNDFGRPLDQVAMMTYRKGGDQDGGSLRLPSVLMALWEALLQRPDGLVSEGIFRLSASVDELSQVRSRLEVCGTTASDSGVEEQREAAARQEVVVALEGASGQCLAALIKLYLRELPDDIWACVRTDLEALPLSEWLADMDDDAAHTAVRTGVLGLLSRLPSHCSQLVLWVCDVMAQVTTHEATNRMGVVAIATVFAPGLVPTPDSCVEPLAMLESTERASRLTLILLRVHLRERLTLSTAHGDAAPRGESATALATPRQGSVALSRPAAERERRASLTNAGHDRSAQAARVAAQQAVYISDESTVPRAGSHVRRGTVRKKRMSVADQMEGLAALLHEIEINPPPESGEPVVISEADRRSASMDV